jgi:hypothetical protein
LLLSAEGLVSVPASIRKEGDACLTFTVLWMLFEKVEMIGRD